MANRPLNLFSITHPDDYVILSLTTHLCVEILYRALQTSPPPIQGGAVNTRDQIADAILSVLVALRCSNGPLGLTLVTALAPTTALPSNAKVRSLAALILRYTCPACSHHGAVAVTLLLLSRPSRQLAVSAGAKMLFVVLL